MTHLTDRPAASTDPPIDGAPRRASAVEEVVVTVLEGDQRREKPDVVAGEEPLEIRVQHGSSEPVPVAVTMRTPGHDFELAVGFLISEGLLPGPDAVCAVRYCTRSPLEQLYNIVTVDTATPLSRAPREHLTVSSSCGLCGTTTLDDLERRCERIASEASIDAAVLVLLPESLRKRQRVFERTGGLHAAGLFDLYGRLLAAREDIGRHNAVDKLVGWAALGKRLPLSSFALAVSGRLSFEIVQKAAVAGIPIVVGVSAPSSLAVATARRLGMTLGGFVRDGRANIYSHPSRVCGL